MLSFPCEDLLAITQVAYKPSVAFAVIAEKQNIRSVVVTSFSFAVCSSSHHHGPRQANQLFCIVTEMRSLGQYLCCCSQPGTFHALSPKCVPSDRPFHVTEQLA